MLLMTNTDYPAGYTCHIRDPKVWKHHDHYYMVQGGRKKRYPQALDFPLANKSNLQYTSLRFTKDRRENA